MSGLPRRTNQSPSSPILSYALHWNQALGKQDARAFARGVFRDEADPDGNARPWAVRGEVPYEDPKALCPCVEMVQSGVRMKLPEKLFARNFLELVQRGNDGPCISIYIDAASALQVNQLCPVGLRARSV